MSDSISSWCKYLGVHFYSELTLNHINKFVNKAKLSIMAEKRMIGKTWGLKLILWWNVFTHQLRDDQSHMHLLYGGETWNKNRNIKTTLGSYTGMVMQSTKVFQLQRREFYFDCPRCTSVGHWILRCLWC